MGSMTGFFADSKVGLISSTVTFWLQLSKGQFAVGLFCPFRWHLIFSCIKMFCLLHGVLQMPYDIHPQHLLWWSNAWLPYAFIYYSLKHMQCVLSSACVLPVNKYRTVHFIFLCKSEFKSHSVLDILINILLDAVMAPSLVLFSLIPRIHCTCFLVQKYIFKIQSLYYIALYCFYI